MPQPTIAALLQQPTRSPFERRVLTRALAQHPWYWPQSPGLDARARMLVPAGPPLVPVGEVLLLTAVHGDPPRGGLARLTVEPGLHGGELLLERSAQDALNQAFGVVSRDLPQLVRPEALARRDAWSAALLPGGPSEQRTLSGDSFGLPFALSAASLLSDVPVPADVAASAVLRPDGTLGPVEGLGAKLEVLCGNALGVRRLLVAGEQEGDARFAARGRLEIVGCGSLAEALRHVFPELEQVTPSSWKTPELARAVARQLYRLAMRPARPLLGWRGVASAAAVLHDALPPDDEVHRAQAAFARDVALRHEGGATPLAWPAPEVLMQMQAPARHTFLAHVVQAATEVGEPSALAETLARARAHVPVLRDAERGGLRLLGAVGRGLARLRRYDEAATLLEEVVEAWRLSLLPEDATLALCELLRIRGLLGDPASLARLGPALDEVLAAPMLDDVSRSFVQQALARAEVELALSGARALDAAALEPHLRMLERIGRARLSVPGHVGLSSLRQLARVYAARGETEEAALLRAQLVSERFGAYALLGRLDAALETGVDVEGALQALEASRFAHHLPRPASGCTVRERAVIMAREYPY